MLAKHKESGCASLVREFYANMVEKEGKRVYVRGQWVEFNREKINKLFNLSVQKDGSKFQETVKGTRTLENSRATHGRKRRMERDKDKSF